MCESILVISDLHFPYEHPDTFDFLTLLKKTFKPDKVISIGDEVDLHSLSYHEKDPSLLGPLCEVDSAALKLKKLAKLFPVMQILESNHGSLVYRKAKTAGLPHKLIKSYRELWDMPKTWTWHNSILLQAPNKMKIHFHHSQGANTLKQGQELGMCHVQGHHHNNFEIRYWATPLGTFWAATVGCLVDDKSLAMAYNKNTVKRPVIGCLVILNGIPQLVPMLLDKRGRWIKRLS